MELRHAGAVVWRLNPGWQALLPKLTFQLCKLQNGNVVVFQLAYINLHTILHRSVRRDGRKSRS